MQSLRTAPIPSASRSNTFHLWRPFSLQRKKKGSPLMRQEVEAIRDQANAMAAPPDAGSGGQSGYKDIDPSKAWDGWQVLRVQFGAGN